MAIYLGNTAIKKVYLGATEIKKIYKGTTLLYSSFTFDPDLLTYIDGLITPLSPGQLILLNTFIVDLKAGLGITNLSDAFDVMYILGGETAESSLRNMIRRAHDATLVNAPLFTALEGYTGNGTNQRLELNYNPSTDGIKFTRDSASQIVYSRTNSLSNGVMGAVSGTNNCYLTTRNSSNQFLVGINTAGYGYVGVNYNSIGMFIGSRTASNVLNGYKNKVQQTPSADASVPVVSLNHVALAVYRGGDILLV